MIRTVFDHRARACIPCFVCLPHDGQNVDVADPLSPSVDVVEDMQQHTALVLCFESGNYPGVQRLNPARGIRRKELDENAAKRGHCLARSMREAVFNRQEDLTVGRPTDLAVDAYDLCVEL